MQRLTQKELERLTKLCGLFSSHHPGEVASAAVKADQFLRERGLGWPDVLHMPTTAPVVAANGNGEPGDPFSRWSDGWRGAVGFAIRHKHLLTKWEAEFVTKIADWYSISERQKPILAGICDKLFAAGCRP
jgi:hypothetical protein